MAFASTQENTNYLRLRDLLDDVGCTVLRDIFDGKHPPANLHVVLLNPSVLPTLKSLRRKGVLNSFQWKKLFPIVPSSVSSANFDVSLLMVLLTNICDLSPPFSTGNWDNLPPDSDNTTEANIVRIKCYRNEFYAHASEASIGDPTFNELWQKISSAILALTSESNYLMYETSISQLKTQCMDPVAEALYNLKEMLEKVKENQERANERLAKIEGNQDRAVEQIVEGMKENQERANERLAKIEGNQDRAVEQIVEGMKELLNPQPCEKNTNEYLEYGQEPSQKHREFVIESMGEMKVTDLRGIGKVYGQNLEEKEYGKAKDVMRQFLLLNKNKEMFLVWIKEKGGVKRNWGEACYAHLKALCDRCPSQSEL